MTTHDPASPVAAALATPESAVGALRDVLDWYAPTPDNRDPTLCLLWSHASAIIAAYDALAARDAEQTARMAALTPIVDTAVEWHLALTAMTKLDAFMRLEALLSDYALLADAGDAQRETGDDE